MSTEPEIASSPWGEVTPSDPECFIQMNLFYNYQLIIIVVFENFVLH